MVDVSDGLLAIFFHYIFTGPKLPQPEPPAREEDL